MTNVFTVIGAHRDNPDWLLLMGDDGVYYACPAPDVAPTPVEPSEEWVFVSVAEVAGEEASAEMDRTDPEIDDPTGHA